MEKENAINRMKEYFGEDIPRINHALRVLYYGEKILNMEQVEQPFIRCVVKMACIFHDIGIKESERKYHSAAAKYQELEGPPVAREIMLDILIRPDILERACYLIGHHHTQKAVDGLDFQILWEADYLVNVEEGWLKMDASNGKEILSQHFHTTAGAAFFQEIEMIRKSLSD